MRKPKKVLWEVSGFGHMGVYLARNKAAAVSQFRKQFDLPIKSDRINGNWPGVSVFLA